MILKEYLTKLAYGTLSNLWGNSTIKGEIPEDKIPLVINAINDGLLHLYTIFPLKESGVYVELNEHTTLYELTTDHIIPEGTEDSEIDSENTCDKYIWDFKEHPFTNDIIKILDVYTTDGFHVKLNNPSSCISVYTPTYNVLQVPNPVKGIVLSVAYQAKHTKLSSENLDSQEIHLTPVLFNALSAYVAYMLYSGINTEVAVANAQKYYSQYQGIINDIISTDALNNSYSQDNTKFFERGWC